MTIITLLHVHVLKHTYMYELHQLLIYLTGGNKADALISKTTIPANVLSQGEEKVICKSRNAILSRTSSRRAYPQSQVITLPYNAGQTSNGAGEVKIVTNSIKGNAPLRGVSSLRAPTTFTVPVQFLPCTHATTETHDVKPNKPIESKLIKGILKSPMENSKGPSTSGAVANIVNSIVSKTRPVPMCTTSQKYVVMPVIRPGDSGSKSYILVNTTPRHVVGCQNSTPLVIKRTVPTSTPMTAMHSSFTKHLKSNCCTAVISAAVDTVSKWLGCNRDIMGKTLIGVADKFWISKDVQALLSSYKHQPTEHIALKWIAITLMLLTKKRMRHVVTDGRPIPHYLFFMWNNLRSFFTVYEGCLLLVRQQRILTKSEIGPNELQFEDGVFNHVVRNIFLAYNSFMDEDLPLPDNLSELLKLLESLDDDCNTGASRPGRSNHLVSNITTVLSAEGSTMPQIGGTMNKQHKK